VVKNDDGEILKKEMLTDLGLNPDKKKPSMSGAEKKIN